MVAVTCLTGFYDVKADMVVHRMGFTDEVRPHLLILNGMLLQVAVEMVEPGPPPKPREGRSNKKARKSFSENAFPDLAGYSNLQKFEPYYDETLLGKYIRRFAETVIPLLNLEPESVDYIWENHGRVVDFLVGKLNKGHLRFFKLRYSEIGPEDGGAVAFLDVSNPEEVVFLYPIFGMKKMTASIGSIPWKPLQNESQEPEQPPVIECKDDLDTIAPVNHTQAVQQVDSESSGNDGE